MRCWSCCLLLLVLASTGVAAEAETFLLAADLAEGNTAKVDVTLEVGGELLLPDDSDEQQVPLTVSGELRYTEQLLSWSDDNTQPIRALRVYDLASAKTQIDKGGLQRELPATKQSVLAEVRDGRSVFEGVESPLTRDQYDLVNVVGNTLALNQLLPGRELKEGDSWDHESASISALLGMDHVAVCEVRSVVTGSKNRQVQIRLAGTVHGTMDGAPTEMQLRGAYLFHEKHKRITKFNLAIKEARTASEVVPGLDVVARVSVKIVPSDKALPANLVEQVSVDQSGELAEPLSSQLRYEAPKLGYEFLHDLSWYVVAEQRDLVSLKLLRGGNQMAHCNVTTLPARSEGRETSLEEFESDVRESLGKNLETVSASTQWTTSQGHECLGVVAQGQVENVPIEWRYYLIASPGLPRVSLSVTIEQSQLEQFDAADRQIVDSLQLSERSKSSTAKAKSTTKSR